MQVKLEKFGNLNIKYIVEKFELYRDSKCTIWFREYFSIEAENREEAINKIISDKVVPYCNEFLFDTSEMLTPEENENFSTEEIYEGSELLYQNAK